VATDARRALVLSVIAIVAAARCGGSPASPTAAGTETLELRLTTAHFRLSRVIVHAHSTR
jgi:hypothetical protein